MKMMWATVTGVSPLRVTLDGEDTALPYVPDSLVDPAALAVDDRVRCELSQRRVVIVGRSGGSGGAAGVPVGCVAHTAAATAPDGWLLCDGSNVSRSTYADLFAAIGTTFGVGNGSTTFTLPNLKGRAAVGRDAGQSEFNTLGETGGAKTHTLTTAEMPSHNHVTGTKYSATSFSSQRTAASGTVGFFVTSSGGTIDPAGGDEAHNNLQPYLVLNGIIKT